MANFKAKRYMTNGIASEIDLSLQQIMWSMIDEAISQDQELDYLQVFKLTPVNVCGAPYQEIIHTQEVPPRSKRITIKSDNPITAKIFVIDSEEYVTMLFSREY